MYCALRYIFVLAFVVLPLTAVADPPEGAVITPNVPDLPPPAGCACADSALANIVKYFSQHGYVKLGQDSGGKTLSDSDLVKAVNAKDPGASPSDAASNYIKEKGYESSLLVHNPKDEKFETIVAELKKGQLVILNLQGGAMHGPKHTVTVAGWSEKDGVMQIGIKDINEPNKQSKDYTGSDTTGTDFYTIHPTDSGFRFDYGPFPFRTLSIVSVSPKPPEKKKKPISESADSAGKSVYYDAVSTSLSFFDDLITASGFINDPLIGAEVTPAPLELISVDEALSAALFRPIGPERFSIGLNGNSILQASIGQMRYDGIDNIFLADLFDITLAGVADDSPFFNPQFATFDSPWINHVSAILDPASTGYQEGGILHLSYRPQVDFWDATDAFSRSAHSEITNSIAVQLVPEPPLLALLAVWASLGFLSVRSIRLDKSCVDPAKVSLVE
jgi:hypothetical protein